MGGGYGARFRMRTVKEMSVSTRRAQAELSKWDAADFEDFLNDVASGAEVTKRVTEAGVTLPVLLNWLSADPEKYARYDRALKIRTEVKALECESIADGTKTAVEAIEIQSAKLRIDTRLRLAGKWNRDRYGDAVKVDGDMGVPGLTFLFVQGEGAPERDVTPKAETIGGGDAPAIEDATEVEPATEEKPAETVRCTETPDNVVPFHVGEADPVPDEI